MQTYTNIIVGPFPIYCAHIACKFIDKDEYFYSSPAKTLCIGKSVGTNEENKQYIQFISPDDKNIVIGDGFIHSFDVFQDDNITHIYFTAELMYGIGNKSIYFFEKNQIYAVNKSSFDLTREISNQLQNNSFHKINLNFETFF